MASSLELPTLYVEGQSDLHTVVQLLARHGISLDKNTGPVVLKDARGDQGVLGSMRTATKASTNLPVGFVMDADASVASRWQAVRDRLKDQGLDLPAAIPASGFVDVSTETKSRVGVWIMPDNQTDDARLEELVKTLVPENDAIFEFAVSSTKTAASKGAKFKPQDNSKAELHCWLSWQEEPGLSFGTAIKVHYFNHDSAMALSFVKWFKELFGV